jgi:hypothetical protein
LTAFVIAGAETLKLARISYRSKKHRAPEIDAKGTQLNAQVSVRTAAFLVRSSALVCLWLPVPIPGENGSVLASKRKKPPAAFFVNDTLRTHIALTGCSELVRKKEFGPSTI